MQIDATTPKKRKHRPSISDQLENINTSPLSSLQRKNNLSTAPAMVEELDLTLSLQDLNNTARRIDFSSVETEKNSETSIEEEDREKDNDDTDRKHNNNTYGHKKRNRSLNELKIYLLFLSS